MDFPCEEWKTQGRKEVSGMWKAAHAELANYLIKQEQLEDLNRHKIAFLVGSILPDCVPSFLTKRHRLEETFPIVKKEIQNLQKRHKVDVSFCLHLGVILHYVADSFTYPHNKTFHGNFLEHCIWEREQWKYLNKHWKKSVSSVPTILWKDLCKHLLKKHDEYLKRGVSLTNDCQYIIEVSFCFAVALVGVTEENRFGEEIRKKGKLQ